jgi:hypothetical protein
VVAFIGSDDSTWTWNGTTWTQFPLTGSHPSGRTGEVMDYDATTGTVVLFGGFTTAKRPWATDTWTWTAAGWTQQHPAAHPTAREDEVMSYDAATGTEVLFGGYASTGKDVSDTWTWDGTTWTKQTAAAHPSARKDAAMAYDAATGTEVLFGGLAGGKYPADTWTWG